jgi:hypothetical protein
MPQPRNNSSGPSVQKIDSGAQFLSAAPMKAHPWQLLASALLLVVWNLFLLVMALWG